MTDFDVHNYTERLAYIISAADDIVAWVDARSHRVWSQAEPEWQRLLATYKNLRKEAHHG